MGVDQRIHLGIREGLAFSGRERERGELPDLPAAVAALGDLERPKPAQAPMAAMPTPPRRWPRKASAALNSAFDMPPSVANWPISRNSGTMDSEWLENWP